DTTLRPALSIIAAPRPACFPYTTLFRSWLRPPRGGRRPAHSAAPRACVRPWPWPRRYSPRSCSASPPHRSPAPATAPPSGRARRSEEHTSELQSRENLVCRLLLEKKTTI